MLGSANTLLTWTGWNCVDLEWPGLPRYVREIIALAILWSIF